MRPPNLQFSDVSKACEALNVPLVAWPEDCGRYSWEEFPEINLYDCVEKYDLIHITPVREDTNPVSTRPGRAYATTFLDDILFLATFEPRDSVAQRKCGEIEKIEEVYDSGYESGFSVGEEQGVRTAEARAKQAYANGYADAASDVESVLTNADRAVEESYLIGYGTGEQRGFDRATLLAAQEWLKGWNAGIVDALDEPQITDPEPLPESSQPVDELSPDFHVATTPFQAIPDEEMQQEEPEPVGPHGGGPHGYGTPLPVLYGLDVTYPDDQEAVDEINTASPETEAVITAVTERDRQHNAETEEEITMEVTQGPESPFIIDESPEVCSPCERLMYMTKAIEVQEIRAVAGAVLAPLAEALGEADAEIIRNMDNLFARTELVLVQLSEVEDIDERDILKAEFAALEIEALAMQSELQAKVEALSG